MHEKQINKLIKQRNYKGLSVIFSSTTHKHHHRNIIPPFDIIIQSHLDFVKNKNFANSLAVCKSACLLYEQVKQKESYVLYKFIIRNCILEIKSDEDTKELIKSVMEIYKNTKYHTITNILLSLYLKIQNYELGYNFLLFTSNDREQKKDFYIYHLYKSLLLLYREDIKESNECINIAFRSKRLRKNNFFIFFFINLINNKFVRTNDKKLIKLSNVVKYGIFTEIQDTINEMEGVLIEHNMIYLAHKYLPLLCWANLIKRLFYLKNEDYKLKMEWLFAMINLEREEVISLTCSVIENNYLKGYISVNKDIIVFSRRDPFPKVLY